MVDINFETLLRAEALVEKISDSLGNYTRFWMDFVTPFTVGEIDDIFETGGRGMWKDLDPLYAARKSLAFPGKGILRRGDVYFEAATSLDHPGNLAEFGPTEMVLGVRGSTVEHAVFHEEGAEDLSARPVYELIAAGAQFSEQIAQLGERWVSEEIEAETQKIR